MDTLENLKLAEDTAYKALVSAREIDACDLTNESFEVVVARRKAYDKARMAIVKLIFS